MVSIAARLSRVHRPTVRLAAVLDAIFTALMIAVCLATAWFAGYVVYRLFKTGENR